MRAERLSIDPELYSGRRRIRSLRTRASDRNCNRPEGRNGGEQPAGELRPALGARGSHPPFVERHAIRNVAMLVLEGLREIGLGCPRRFPFLMAPADAPPLSPIRG